MVTGASRGIGRAVALELGRRGFNVIASMRTPSAGASLEAEAARIGLPLRVARLDVDAPDSIAIPNDLRVLVNNAAIEEDYLPVEETPMDQWRRVFATNVFGLVEVTRRAIPTLRAKGGGVICNITSSSLLAPMPFYAVYRASKAAVSAIGNEPRPVRIRIIEVLPGPIETDMLAGSDRTYEAAAYAPYKEMAERSLANRRGVIAGTSAEEAARAIADAICADDGPLRIACDPMSAQMLEMWRQVPDEQWMRSMMSLLWPRHLRQETQRKSPRRYRRTERSLNDLIRLRFLRLCAFIFLQLACQDPSELACAGVMAKSRFIIRTGLPTSRMASFWCIWPPRRGRRTACWRWSIAA